MGSAIDLFPAVGMALAAELGIRTRKDAALARLPLLRDNRFSRHLLIRLGFEVNVHSLAFEGWLHPDGSWVRFLSGSIQMGIGARRCGELIYR